MGIEGADGKLSQWPARIVATDAAHDLAVLQIDAPPETLQPIKVPTHCQAGGCPENCCLRQNVHAFFLWCQAQYPRGNYQWLL